MDNKVKIGVAIGGSAVAALVMAGLVYETMDTNKKIKQTLSIEATNQQLLTEIAKVNGIDVVKTETVETKTETKTKTK